MTDKNKIELIKNIIDVYYDAMPGIEDNKERDLYQQGILDCINSIIYYEEKCGSGCEALSLGTE